MYLDVTLSEAKHLRLHFRNVNDAIACKKKMKRWRRSRKVSLVEHTNPRWLDLSDDWEQQPKLYDRPWETEEMT